MSKAKIENIEQTETLSDKAQKDILGGGTKGLIGDEIGLPLKKKLGPDLKKMESVDDDE